VANSSSDSVDVLRRLNSGGEDACVEHCDSFTNRALADDEPADSGNPFDDFAATAARTAVWPIGALSAFAIEEMLKQHLELAEKHVRLGAGHIASQKAIVARYVRAGLDATLAMQLLKTFADLHCSHIANRDRLTAELAKALKR
jgi:hypothetical protein